MSGGLIRIASGRSASNDQHGSPWLMPTLDQILPARISCPRSALCGCFVAGSGSVTSPHTTADPGARRGNRCILTECSIHGYSIDDYPLPRPPTLALTRHHIIRDRLVRSHQVCASALLLFTSPSPLASHRRSSPLVPSRRILAGLLQLQPITRRSSIQKNRDTHNPYNSAHHYCYLQPTHSHTRSPYRPYSAE